MPALLYIKRNHGCVTLRYNSTTFNELIVCSDTGIHGFPHLLIGGAWPSEQSPQCVHHAHSLSQFLTETVPGYSYQWAPSVGCITPVESCTLDQPETECAYTIASETGMCAGQYDFDPTVQETIIGPEMMSIGGDFTDGQTSANDPLFFAHHLNMDRLYTRKSIGFCIRVCDLISFKNII